MAGKHNEMARWLSLLACVAAGAASVGAGTVIDAWAAGQSRRAQSTYEGTIVAGTGGAVSFTAKRRGDEYTAAQFRAMDVVIVCDDGTTKTYDFSLALAPFVTKRHFDRDRFNGDPTASAYYRVHGEIRKHGEARGFVFYHDTNSERDCTTAGGKEDVPLLVEL